MIQIKTFSDQRLDQMCSYCGDIGIETRDHVPSRILLDEPFPENFPVVPCCLKCNQYFSLDEEYFACAIECILHGTTNVDKLKREKVKAILERKQSLRQRIENSFVLQDGQIHFQIEQDRFENVITKLAKGHAKYETSEPQLDEPLSISMTPLMLMTEEELDKFFAPKEMTKFPEVGSRSLINLIENTNIPLFQWTTVQENNYLYSVTSDLGTLSVKIVIWDYLAVEVIWD